MSTGLLTKEQKEAIKPYLKGLKVLDVGAGDLDLAYELRRLGADRIIALDKEELPRPRSVRIETVQARFTSYTPPDDVTTAFVSWPINNESASVGIIKIIREIAIVIYLGSNTSSSMCGTPTLFEVLTTRPVLVHIPDRRNTLIVYGAGHVQREPLWEEHAGLSAYKSEILPFQPPLETP